jgi:2-succinyl-6-hydroxy-2,4-cyclohexadiene-1-carboxylate synthase
MHNEPQFWHSHDGAHYAYDISGEGRPVLLLHGFTGSRVNWQDIIPLLADCRVLAVDLPGHGRTEVPRLPGRFALDRVAADLSALAQAVFGGVQPHVVGYSMGGRHALALALHAPSSIASLTLESASPGLKTEAERQQRRISDDALADAIRRNGMAWFAVYWEALPLFASQRGLPHEKRQWLREQRTAGDPAGLAHSLRDAGTGAQPSYWDALGALARLPIHLIAGALDEKYVAIQRQMAAALPQARMTIMPDAGHAVHLEQPEAYAAAVLAFLSSFTR